MQLQTDCTQQSIKEMKKELGILSVVVGALTYTGLIISTYKGNGEGLSFPTFGLWAVLAWVTVFTVIKQGANPAIPSIYGFGSTATALVLLLKGKCFWSPFDSLVAVLVVICIIFWMTRGAKFAFVLSIAAGVIAGLPYFVMTWKTPSVSPIIPNICFLISNILAFISADAWTIKDRLYTGTGIVTCSLLIIPWVLCK